MAENLPEQKYSLKQRLHYRFNWNVDRVLIHLQCHVHQITPPPTPEGMELRVIDPDSDTDARLWTQVMSAAYPGAGITAQTLRQNWRAHPLLRLEYVVLAFDRQQPVATISAGRYRADPDTGGAGRVAVIPERQRQGVGTWMMSALFAEGPTYGYHKAEATALVSNETSIRVLLRLGLRIQEDWSKVIPTGQRRMWPARTLAMRRARRIADELFDEYPDLRRGPEVTIRR